MKGYLKTICVAVFLGYTANINALDNPDITVPSIESGNFAIIQQGKLPIIVFDSIDAPGIEIAIDNLAADFGRVAATSSARVQHYGGIEIQNGNVIIAGSIASPMMRNLSKKGIVDMSGLQGKNEMYQISFAPNPYGDGEALIIAGSDRRGTIYGIYELSEQIGVSPWNWWADVPVKQVADMSVKKGLYTAGEPAVKYRGLFLNDEAPCLTGWVKNYFGTSYGGHDFYQKVFELILRLRGNFLWPAMWGWAFYADDPQNSLVADRMGVIMGTSHHEPMARNHQEYARHRQDYGPWNYNTNQAKLDEFFAEGIRRMASTEDVVTIGMRGDGDEAMSAEADVKLLEKIIKNQRNIIRKVTGKRPQQVPQVWALYKEVLDYYDKGLRVPDDVILLLCDDNWGNVRRLPNQQERKHPGGWGMYYHVDYVGAPRNSKWLNVTPVQNMWEQLSLTYEYGVDKLWVLNVGDLKPMEYPITLFLDMAWNPNRYDAQTLENHILKFCKQQFGEDQAEQAARILNLYSKYNGRITAEMLNANTYNVDNGEWRQVRDQYISLEAEALRQFLTLDASMQDAYRQLILFPVQAMANVYDMYYSQAMNHKLAAQENPECNFWADQTEKAFRRDAMLQNQYNTEMSAGKWNGMMTQKHIGYTSWNDNFPADRMPEVFRIDPGCGDYVFNADDGMAIIEAEHYYQAKDAENAQWTIIPDMGRTLSGITLMPRLPKTDGAELIYKVQTGNQKMDSVEVHVVVKSTLAFENLDGHRYSIQLNDGEPVVVNFNSNLNEKPENIYDIFYPTVASRVVESTVKMPIKDKNGLIELVLRPLDAGIVFEKVVLDWGGYHPGFLFGTESQCYRQNK